jgi:hypothetical protein
MSQTAGLARAARAARLSVCRKIVPRNEDSSERWSQYPSGLDSGPGAMGNDIVGFTWDLLYDSGRWFPDRPRGVPIFTVGIFRTS